MTLKKFNPTLDPSTYIFHEDSGHGWLEVPLKALRALNIGHMISTCSYVHEGKAYLEEDRDGAIFINALDDYLAVHGLTSLYRNFEIKTVYDGHQSPILNYRRYKK